MNGKVIVSQVMTRKKRIESGVEFNEFRLPQAKLYDVYLGLYGKVSVGRSRLLKALSTSGP